MAHIIEVTEQGMRATDRCDRCGAQAYIEVSLTAGGVLLFCAHHASEHWPKIVAMDAMIADHRPALRQMEKPATAPA